MRNRNRRNSIRTLPVTDIVPVPGVRVQYVTLENEWAIDCSTWDLLYWTGSVASTAFTGAGTSQTAVPAISNRIAFILLDDVGRKYTVTLAPNQIFSLRGKSIKKIAYAGPSLANPSSGIVSYAYVGYSI